MAAKVMPMFPLGSVLFPFAVMPLHVFEPRYRDLVETCLRGDGRFGVVLIEHGSEVGGGESRFEVGTVARIVDAARTPDGRYLLATVGTDRFRVRKWLPDDPYPRAEIDLLPVGAPTHDAARSEALQRLLVRVLALRTELDEPAPPVDAARLDDDLGRASFEAASLAPFNSFDAQGLLELDVVEERVSRIEALLREQAELLELRLSTS